MCFQQKYNQFAVFTIVLSMQFSGGAYASETDLCPVEIFTIQNIDQSRKGRWIAYGTNEVNPWANVSFFSGPPDQKAQLAPTSEKRNGGIITVEWDLPRSTDGYWVACEYAGTTVVVARSLEANVNSCVADYSLDSGVPSIKMWQCNSRP